MIITRLFGGLGNQLFQYALGRVVAYKNNVELKLDISLFDTYELRKYELGVFNIVENFARKEEIKNYKNKKLFKFINIKNKKYFEQKKFGYDDIILKVKKHAYLAGYWTSPKYFDDFADIIRYDFSLKPELQPKGRFEEMIRNTNSVSIHVRRGDYVSNSETRALYDVCNLQYYSRAIDYIVENVENPIFFVFSDDIEWVKQNLEINFEKYFMENNGKDYEDLMLMSLCKNNIIANSTFSWWGAWLNSNVEKIIIAPEIWFNDIEKNKQTVDLIPEGWMRL